MTESETRSSIDNQYSKISSYQSDINALHAKISELENTHMQVCKTQKSFEESCDMRRRSLASVESCCVNPKIECEYAAGMSRLLSGTEYNNAYCGLDEAKGKLKSKISELENEVAYYQGKIFACHSQIGYLNSLL